MGKRCDPCPHKRYTIELDHARGVVIVDVNEGVIVEVVDVEPKRAIPVWIREFAGFSMRHVARLNPDASIRLSGWGRTGVRDGGGC